MKIYDSKSTNDDDDDEKKRKRTIKGRPKDKSLRIAGTHGELSQHTNFVIIQKRKLYFF